MSDETGRYSGDMTGGSPFGSGVLNGQVSLSKLRLCYTQPQLGSAAKAYLYGPAAVMFDRMVQAAFRDGVRLYLNSGYRTLAQQQHLWDLAQQGLGNPAAPPGTSNHGFGVAADIRTGGNPAVFPWLKAHAYQYGWDHPRWAADGVGTEEAWHWQWIKGFAPPTSFAELNLAGWLVVNADTFLRPGERDAVPTVNQPTSQPNIQGPIAQLQYALRVWANGDDHVLLGRKLKVDGAFGDATFEVVRHFQILEGLVPTNDALVGTAGPSTRKRITERTQVPV